MSEWNEWKTLDPAVVRYLRKAHEFTDNELEIYAHLWADVLAGERQMSARLDLFHEGMPILAARSWPFLFAVMKHRLHVPLERPCTLREHRREPHTPPYRYIYEAISAGEYDQLVAYETRREYRCSAAAGPKVAADKPRSQRKATGKATPEEPGLKEIE